MNRPTTLSAFLFLGLVVCLARADGPDQAFVPNTDAQDAGKNKPKPADKDKKTPEAKDKKTPEKDLVKQPEVDIFDQAFLPRGETSTAFNPHMMGDFPGIFARQNFTIVGVQTTSTTVRIRDPIATATFPESSPPSVVITTIGNHGLANGQQVTITGSSNPAVNGTWKITVLGRNQFALNGFNNNGSAIIGLGGLVTATTTTSATTPVAQTRSILVPSGSSTGAFKVAENESPRPQDRVFFTYNYYGSLQGLAGPSNDVAPSTQTVVTGNPGGFGGTTTTTTSTTLPGLPRVTANLSREVFGFEKTFLDGYASFEMRVPVSQQQSNFDSFNANDAGDLTIIGKYAFILDQRTGNVLSGGLAITVPTGPRIDTIDGPLHSTLLQPWLGYIWNADKFFVQAFHSIVVPTDSRDITLLFNDVGVNYWLYRNDSNRVLKFIVPMAEVHVTTPLNHRDAYGAVYVPDLVDLTGGVHLGLFRNTTLSFGVATPVTGPRVFNVEGFVQLNWRF